MLADLSDASTVLEHEIDALAPTTRRHFLGKVRQGLRDIAEQVRHWLNATIAVFTIAVAGAVFSVSRSHGLMFAHLFFATALLSLCGAKQTAAWLACVGCVCIEALGLTLVVVRPADDLERELVDAAVLGTPTLVRAAVWFGGGCMYGLQPLRTDCKRALGLAGLGVVVLRLLVTCKRCAEGSGLQVLTTVLPRTVVPLCVGCYLSSRLVEALVNLLRSLVGESDKLSRAQGSWLALRDCYSQMHVLLSALPPTVRMQYTGTDGIPIPKHYGTDDEKTKMPIWMERDGNALGNALVDGRVEQRPLAAVGTCIICQSEPPTHLYSPCGHRCACSQCAARWDELGSGNCPFCATPYEHFLRVFDVS